jgi:ribosome assembly protein YihI (activator of Der GTPase)
MVCVIHLRLDFVSQVRESLEKRNRRTRRDRKHKGNHKGVRKKPRNKDIEFLRVTDRGGTSSGYRLCGRDDLGLRRIDAQAHFP